MKKLWCIVLFLIVGVVAVGMNKIYIMEHSFTTEKWLEESLRRDKIVNDFIEHYYVNGMKESQIVLLLGDSEQDREGEFYNKFNNEKYDLKSTLVYYIGDDILESKWLIISLLDGKSIRIEIGVN